MKKTFLLLSTSICMVSTVSFGMEVKPYIEGKVSENFMKAEYSGPGYSKDFKDTAVLGGALEVGAKIDQFRVGLEGYYNDDMEDKYYYYGFGLPVEMESKGFFLNGYYDFTLPNNEKIKPYIGAGIGYSWLKASIIGFSEKDHDLSWNIGLGMGYELNKNIDLTLGYRYENLGKVEYYNCEAELTNHKVLLGLRYTF